MNNEAIDAIEKGIRRSSLYDLSRHGAQKQSRWAESCSKQKRSRAVTKTSDELFDASALYFSKKRIKSAVFGYNLEDDDNNMSKDDANTQKQGNKHGCVRGIIEKPCNKHLFNGQNKTSNLKK
eukprot:209829_1